MTDLITLENSFLQSNGNHDVPAIPHALCVTVFLSQASFSYETYTRGTKNASKRDIKVEVYYNGQFVESQIATRKQFISSGIRGTKARIIRFTGQKVNRMIEKPWVYVPPSRNHENTSRGLSDDCQGNDRDSILRWSAISKELIAEAGRNEAGGRTILSEYLESLASLSIPSEVVGIQEADDLRFGVIDVIVLWGSGHKDGPDSIYLTKPTRMRAEQDRNKSKDDEVANSPQRPSGNDALEPDSNGVAGTKSTVPSSTPMHTRQSGREAASPDSSSDGLAFFTPEPHLTTPNLTPSLIPSAEAGIQPETRAEALATALPIDGNSVNPSKPLIRELFPPSRSASLKAKRSRALSTSSSQTTILNPNPPKRTRMPYHHVLTTKQTLAEELESIAEQAIEKVHRTRESEGLSSVAQAKRTEDSPLSQEPSSVEEVSLVDMPKRKKLVMLKISPEKMESLPLKLSYKLSSVNIDPALSRPSLSGPSDTRDAIGGSSSASISGIPSNSRKHPSPSDPTNIVGRRGETLPSGAASILGHHYSPASQPTPAQDLETFDANFVIPELSKDCCITYAAPGVVRNVGAVRGGWFKEEGVVMGTRFIVG